MLSAENVPNRYDFREDIHNAISNAPYVEMSESGLSIAQALEDAQKLERLADRQDDSVITRVRDNMLGDVFIEEAHAYPVLVRQAMEMVYPPFIPKRLIDTWCRESVEHEMAHAAAASMLDKDVQYGVRIVKVKDTHNVAKLMMTCLIDVIGPNITKADLAFITAAPENISEGDKHVLRSLGYTSLQT